MLPGRLLSHIQTHTASRHHRAPLASLIRSSFRQAGHFHKPLIQSPSLSVATLRSSFLHSFHALRSPTAAGKPVTACFGFRLPAHLRIAAFVSLSFALLSYGGQSGTRLMQLLLVQVAAAFKEASQEPPSSAHVRTRLPPCLPSCLLIRLPKASTAPT